MLSEQDAVIRTAAAHIERLRARIDELYSENDLLRREAVLEAAARANSPLHDDFDWDDTSAARAHRLQQVRTMRCSLQIEVINTAKKVEHIRAFVRRVATPGFVPVLEASAEELTQAEQECWCAAQKFRQRFKGLQFAKEIVEAIADKEKSLNRSGGAKRRKAG